MTLSRRIAKALLVVAAGLVGLAALALIALQTPWVKDYLRGVAERQAERYIDADVQIGSLSGNLLFGATLDDVRVVQEGEPVVAIDRVGLDYSVFDLLGGTYDIQEIRLARPVVRLDRGEAGWGLLGIFAQGAQGAEQGEQPRTEEGKGADRAFSLGEIVVSDGTVIVGQKVEKVGDFSVPDRITDFDAKLGITREAGDTAIRVDRLSFVGQSPEIIVQEVSGTVSIEGDDLVFDQLVVRLADTSFTLDGDIQNYRAALQ